MENVNMFSYVTPVNEYILPPDFMGFSMRDAECNLIEMTSGAEAYIFIEQVPTRNCNVRSHRIPTRPAVSH